MVEGVSKQSTSELVRLGRRELNWRREVMNILFFFFFLFAD